MKTPNKVGGGANTNANGLAFEGRTDLRESLRNHPDFEIVGHDVLFKGSKIAEYYEKHDLYKHFLEPRNIDSKKIISKKLLPDGALFNATTNTMYIIEKKYQEGSGSVDEKLQTCDFKKKQYQKLFCPIGINVEYYYVLNNWFSKSEYRDVFEYIESVGCKYFIEELPFNEIGL